ncbi:hybrid sensor histidine kinase/response regulator [Erythrobacter sp. WG]|uniref:hybrid sensor histidine kinase/response regulator n=1 Tax=Erythrobacter sp. WG TaxID=2985510 RepID=UPI00226E4556|nr:hybrid sensor histidine kinase/response regulator [Erythrobacter sp. WG]MCX9146516.1 hybrid sensor histidine kinase/response regulator [Erythrobacter sp. WG]
MTSTPKFLLVDDLEENLLALEALLKREGLELHCARSGEEALELILENEYALALLDVQMPGMDGFELAEFMRANTRSQHIPIIFLTAGRGDATRRFNGYEAGAVDFIQKPIEPTILRSKSSIFLDLFVQRQQIVVQRDELVALTAALQAADQQKNRFLGVLAHELRNPLAVLSSGVALLELPMGDLDTDAVRKSMRQNVRHMSRLIDDLLDINRIEHGKISLKKERVDLGEILPHALEIAQPAIDAGGHELAVSLPDEQITLDADPARVIQIVGNIVGNAARYTPNGGRIEVTVSRNAPHAILTVADNGVGIAPEQQSIIFEMFGQSDNVLGISGGGLGIGLALVKQLVELHSGEVRLVKSVLDEGSVFEVRLPLAS